MITIRRTREKMGEQTFDIDRWLLFGFIPLVTRYTVQARAVDDRLRYAR